MSDEREAEDFWRRINHLDAAALAMRRAWWRLKWRDMADHADEVAAVAAKIAKHARDVADREEGAQ